MSGLRPEGQGGLRQFWYQSLFLFVHYRQKEQRKTECWRPCDGCLQVGNNQGDSQEDCGRGWKHSGVQSDNNGFSRRADRNNKMAIKGYTSVGRKDLEMMSKAEWDEELVEMRARMDELAFEM
jgi:hypothetical protein